MKRYKCEDGSHLVVDCDNKGYRIFWYVPHYEELGLVVGSERDCFAHHEDPPADHDEWECWMSERVMATIPHVEFDSTGYLFDTEAAAKKALKLINQALLDGGKPWPVWALTAKEAGWTPPEGWKP